ncbi:MAG: gluconeogenesis factor YvcK family protein [Chthonomonadales bacterium]
MSNPLPSLKWLYPGMRVKRWLALAAIGIAVGLLGASLLLKGEPVDALALPNTLIRWIARKAGLDLHTHPAAVWAGAALAAVGVALLITSVQQLALSISSALNPGGGRARIADTVYRNRYLAQGPRVVAIGGGTGLSTMLRGLKQYTSNIVAVVTVTDDGGSSGKLQTQLNILPPGDIRNCLVALADAESTMLDLFQYRFHGREVSEGLRDHAFGNLLIAAMSAISGGDFEEAVRRTSHVLNIRGRVLPSTLTHIKLRAEMEDGSILEGETTIAGAKKRIRKIWLDPPNALPLDEVLEAIALADVIVIGPGSVFTSVIPNLLVRGIPEALHKSRARKVYICNVMTQPGETDGFSASDHVKAISVHVERPVFDYVMVNTGVPTLELLNKYRQSGAILVEPDTDRIRAMGYKPIRGSFISQTDVVRHDAARLAEAIMRLVPKGRRGPGILSF